MTPKAGGLRFRVRVTPKGGRDAVDGWQGTGETRVLKLRVRAVPEDGKANAAVVALLAETLGVPKSRIAIASGETSRIKTIAAEDKDGLLAARLEKFRTLP